jgi:hypothetical protein
MKHDDTTRTPNFECDAFEHAIMFTLPGLVYGRYIRNVQLRAKHAVSEEATMSHAMMWLCNFGAEARVWVLRDGP